MASVPRAGGCCRRGRGSGQVAGAGSFRSVVIMLTRSSVQRPVLDRCSTVRRPEVAIAAEQPDDCSFRRNAVTATTGSPSPSISRTGSQRSRAATTAPLLAATSVDKARSSPSPLIMTQTVAPPDVRQHDWVGSSVSRRTSAGPIPSRCARSAASRRHRPPTHGRRYWHGPGRVRRPAATPAPGQPLVITASATGAPLASASRVRDTVASEAIRPHTPGATRGAAMSAGQSPPKPATPPSASTPTYGKGADCSEPGRSSSGSTMLSLDNRTRPGGRDDPAQPGDQSAPSRRRDQQRCRLPSRQLTSAACYP